MAELVIDASAMVDLLLGGPLGEAVGRRLRGHALHAPAHLAAEVLSALGRLSRADALAASDVDLLVTTDGRLAPHPTVEVVAA